MVDSLRVVEPPHYIKFVLLLGSYYSPGCQLPSEDLFLTLQEHAASLTLVVRILLLTASLILKLTKNATK